ncbi:Phytoene dehydrogenase [Myriangium duriaei CBS 260.36]|uniref:Phytoene desaturase n=1 Tax=Myriangium duriaei CBS 260.36 TaxID=1168546 RepID=A0A9P4J8J9_9PEZI|nr:Phytoene dehydrogenase [Myriangium duriaei CBS 260.36]
MVEKRTAIVIGAGVGGVSTAAHLAKAGFQVTVLEKNDFSGGRCSLIHHKGWRFDQGPSLLLLPELFRQTFHDLDTSLEAEDVHILKCDPNYKVWFGDGEEFRLSTDMAAMKTEIEKWEGKDGFRRYLDYVKEGHDHYELSVSHVLLRNFTSILSMTRTNFMRHLFSLHPFESIYSRTSKYFHTDRLRRVFTFASMYMGISPYDAPGTYSLLQYTELAEGIWYPVGGFNKVVQALVGIGERLGAQYRFSTQVKSILLSKDGGRAVGVQLASGEKLLADVVVNNSDLVYAYNNLLPTTKYAEALSQRDTSCSSISFYWALDRKVPELSAHNIFLANEYRESFDAIFKKHLIPNEPSFYVNVPSRVDPTAAPEGKDTIVVLVPVGHLHDTSTTASVPDSNPPLSKSSDSTKLTKSDKISGIAPSASQDWPEMIALARRTILSTISSRIGTAIGPLITHEQTNDPTTWQQKFNLDRGAILGLSHSFLNVLSFRPTTRARGPGLLDGVAAHLPLVLQRVAEVLAPGPAIEALYFVGASTHPGTGVPICLAGGKIVAEQVLEDLRMEVPWRRAEVESEERLKGRMGTTGREMDVVRALYGEGWVQIVVLLVAVMLAFFVWTGR